MNRLTLGDHKDYTSVWTDNNNYEEKLLVYDKNGNIKHLLRTNSLGGTMADYTYAYSGNQLATINGGAPYTYDKNGNATLDALRGVTVAYNMLNLPKTVSKGTDIIAYIYSASGEKLAKKMKDNTYQYYAGSMVYKNDKSLNYLLFEEGIVNKVSGGYSYEYHLKDHLGNTRVAFQPNGSTTTVTQVAEYYPFGSSYLPVSPIGTNRYLYNGKEKQDDVLSLTALDWYDYGARFYDPAIGRWSTQDRFSEKYYSLSNYQYGGNNPMLFIDFNGDTIVSTTRQDNQIIIENSPIEDGGKNYNNTITLAGAKQNDVSDYSASIVNDAMNAINDDEVTISSGKRTSENQAETMYNNAENKGVDSQKKLYGDNGKKVIDVYSDYKGFASEFGINMEKETKAAMNQKITEIGPGKVSKHCRNDATLNVFDIAPSSVSNVKLFQTILSSDKRVATLIPYPKDPGIHLEIKQRKR